MFIKQEIQVIYRNLRKYRQELKKIIRWIKTWILVPTGLVQSHFPTYLPKGCKVNYLSSVPLFPHL